MAELFDFGAQESPKSLSHSRVTHFSWLLVDEPGPKSPFRCRQGPAGKYENGRPIGLGNPLVKFSTSAPQTLTFVCSAILSLLMCQAPSILDFQVRSHSKCCSHMSCKGICVKSVFIQFVYAAIYLCAMHGIWLSEIHSYWLYMPHNSTWHTHESTWLYDRHVLFFSVRSNADSSCESTSRYASFSSNRSHHGALSWCLRHGRGEFHSVLVA